VKCRKIIPQLYGEKFVAPMSKILQGVMRHCGHPVLIYQQHSDDTSTVNYITSLFRLHMLRTIPDELSNTNPEERNYHYLQSSSN
jgi:hypothetical protein